MGFLIPKIRQRVQIQIPVQTPNSFGGADQTYETQTTVWAEIKPVSQYIQAIRGAQIMETGGRVRQATHQFLMRTCGIQSLGRQFSLAFDTGYDGMADINLLKSDWYLFMQSGSTVKGTRYRIKGIDVDYEASEYLKIYAEQIEESGTGYQA